MIVTNKIKVKGNCVSCGAYSPDNPLCERCDEEVTGWTWLCNHGGCKACGQGEYATAFEAKADALKHGDQHCCPNHYTVATLGRAVTREEWEAWRGAA